MMKMMKKKKKKRLPKSPSSHIYWIGVVAVLVRCFDIYVHVRVRTRYPSCQRYQLISNNKLTASQ